MKLLRPHRARSRSGSARTWSATRPSTLWKQVERGDFVGAVGSPTITEDRRADDRRRERADPDQGDAPAAREVARPVRTSRSATASATSTSSSTPRCARSSASARRSCAASARFLDARGFLEVETPMMHSIARRRGGAAVRDPPQRARHRSLHAHRARAATSSGWSSAASSASTRSAATSATRGCRASTTPSSRCSSSTRPTRPTRT